VADAHGAGGLPDVSWVRVRVSGRTGLQRSRLRPARCPVIAPGVGRPSYVVLHRALHSTFALARWAMRQKHCCCAGLLQSRQRTIELFKAWAAHMVSSCMPGICIMRGVQATLFLPSLVLKICRRPGWLQKQRGAPGHAQTGPNSRNGIQPWLHVSTCARHVNTWQKCGRSMAIV